MIVTCPIGVAMMGQAILSVAYHMCPTRDNFRFDSTFMYVQSGLGIHKLLQSRTPDKDPGLHEIMLLLTALLVAVVIETVRVRYTLSALVDTQSASCVHQDVRLKF